MSERLDVGLDVDNVLYPWSTVYTRWVERRKGLLPGALDDVALSWTWYRDQWGMETDEFLKHYTAGVLAGVIFTHGDPDIGSVSTARRLHEAGHRLHYITNRVIPGVDEEHAWFKTFEWLSRHGFPIDSLTVSADKNSVRTDVFLDDSPQNIAALVSAEHPKPLLWHRPHNDGAVLPLFTRRVRSWHEFERIVAVEAEKHGALR